MCNVQYAELHERMTCSSGPEYSTWDTANRPSRRGKRYRHRASEGRRYRSCTVVRILICPPPALFLPQRSDPLPTLDHHNHPTSVYCNQYSR